MATYKAYFDGSGSSDTNVLAVAGFVAKSVQWAEFERNWNEVLTKFSAPPLHMRHFAHSLKEFAEWKGNENMRRSFLTALIATIKLRVQHSFASAVVVSDYKQMCSEFPSADTFSPYGLAGCTCISKVSRWAKRQKIDFGDIEFVLEYGDNDQSDLKRKLEKYYRLTPLFLTKNESSAFQAADLLAYEYLSSNIRIYRQEFGSLALSDFRKPLQKLYEIPNGPDADDWGVHDKQTLPRFFKEFEWR